MNNFTKKYIKPFNPLSTLSTQKVLKVNPTVLPNRSSSKESIISLYRYSTLECKFYHPLTLSEIDTNIKKDEKNWLNIDVLHKENVEIVANLFSIHPLILEDILSTNQRPKIDELENQIYCVMQMVYYNETTKSVENEQVSFVLGKNILLSFQDDDIRDVFTPVREKLKFGQVKLETMVLIIYYTV